MAKQTGLGDNLYIGGVNVSGDTQQLDNIGGGPALIDVTGIDKSAFERIGGLRSGQIDFTSFFNKTGAHPVLSVLPDTDGILTYCRGTALGSATANMVGKRLSYDGTRSETGEFTFKVSAQSNGYGLEWGLLGTPGIRTESAATNGTAVDLGSTWSASFGLQAYLHVFALASGTPTIKLQGSPDNSTWTDVTGGAFGAVTAASAQRIATSNTQAVARYFRVSTTGTFSGLSFAVAVVPNAVAKAF